MRAMLLIASTAPLVEVFVRVALCVALEATVTLPKERVEGATVTLGRAIPVPVKLTIWGLD